MSISKNTKNLIHLGKTKPEEMKTKLEDVTNRYQKAMQKNMENFGISKEWYDKHVVFYMANEDKPKEEKKKWALL